MGKGSGAGGGFMPRLFLGSGVVCQSTDNSWYCSLTKLTSAVINILLLFAIFYYILGYGIPYLFKMMKKSGSSR